MDNSLADTFGEGPFAGWPEVAGQRRSGLGSVLSLGGG